jgi:hypothetical protein
MTAADLFGGELADTLVGQKVRQKTRCDCGDRLSAVEPCSKGGFELRCAGCGKSHGPLSRRSIRWIVDVAALVGAPPVIDLARQPIAVPRSQSPSSARSRIRSQQTAERLERQRAAYDRIMAGRRQR